MRPDNALAYMVLLAVGILTVRLGIVLSRRFPLKPLRFYAIYLAASLGVGFLKIVGNYTSQELLFRQSASPTIHASVAWVFALLAWPFSIAAVYAAIAMILAWAGKRFSLGGQVAYFILQIALLAAFMGAGPALLSEEKVRLAGISVSLPAISSVNVLLQAAMLAALVLVWLPRSNNPLRAGLTNFALLWSLVLIGGFVLLNVLTSGRAYRVADPLVTFVSNLPPLLYLRAWLARYSSAHPLRPVAEDRMAAVFERYRISEREAEIIRLLLDGKSYRDIESELFISFKTVQSHVYNVYKKMGVKSRWQLLNLFQHAEDGPLRSGWRGR